MYTNCLIEYVELRDSYMACSRTFISSSDLIVNLILFDEGSLFICCLFPRYIVYHFCLLFALLGSFLRHFWIASYFVHFEHDERLE